MAILNDDVLKRGSSNNTTLSTQSTTSDETPSESTPTKRKRGRPRKI